jgi:delta(3,5)-delta(2,4)-dienoyl-CoA isomerase
MASATRLCASAASAARRCQYSTFSRCQYSTFSEAQAAVKTLASDPSNDDKLQLYALYKQATVGPNTHPKPGMLDFVGGAKWSAWKGVGALSAAEAEAAYVALARRLAGAPGTAPPLPAAATTAADPFTSLRTLRVARHGAHVFEVALARPEKLNAMSSAMFSELGDVFRALSATAACRAVVLTGGDSRAFTSGLDLIDHAPLLGGGAAASGADPARAAAVLRRTLERYQAALCAVASCRSPVFAAVAGACIGGGVDLICAADVRVVSACATFSVREAALGLCADLGTLQRLPRLVGSDSWAREVCLTARDVGAEEALARGFVSQLLPSPAAARECALALAARVAALSPIATLGTKANLNFARDSGAGLSASLAYQSAWSGASLQTADIPTSIAGKGRGEFADVP